MGYTADITGFPYWKNNVVKVERKSWDKVAKDLMKVADQRTELEKSVGKTEDWLDKEMLKNEKLKEDMKSLKKENKFYLRKMEKMKEEIKKLKKEIIEWEEEYCSAESKAEGFEEEIIQLKEEKFDNMEELAKRDGMCLVDIHIFDKLLAQEEENKELKLELKAAQEVSVVYMKRYDQKAKEERQIDEICSRIKCDDKFGHLIGKVPHH